MSEDFLDLGNKLSGDLSGASLKKLRLTCSLRREDVEEAVALWNKLLFCEAEIRERERAQGLLPRTEHPGRGGIVEGLNPCLDAKERGQREPYLGITPAA